MIATVDSLFSAALALPEDSRLQLAERLMSSVDCDPEALETEQLAEVKKRQADVQAGRVQLLPGEEVFQELRQTLALRRQG